LSVGLIAALPAEVRCFTHTVSLLNVPFAINPHLTGIVCGIGRDHAGAAAKTLLDLDIDALVSWGTAGALSPDLRSGDLMLPEKILSVDGRWFVTDKIWLDRIRFSLQPVSLRIHNGPMTDTREILSGAAQKRELHLRTGALAADMETAAIMENASARNVPCIAIRSVVDEAHMAIPEALVRHIDRYGRPQPAGLILEIFRSPRLLGALWRLGIAMHRATSTLKTVARRAHPALLYNQ
jgi:hopanoid-associated phosphorylase